MPIPVDCAICSIKYAGLSAVDVRGGSRGALPLMDIYKIIKNLVHSNKPHCIVVRSFQDGILRKCVLRRKPREEDIPVWFMGHMIGMVM